MSNLTLVIGNKNYSSWSLRAWFLLKEMELDFEEIILKLDTDEFDQVIEGYSPSKRVPVLRDDDLVIWDTLAISEYLNETYPEKQLWPEDIHSRTLARAVSSEMHSGFMALRQFMPMNCRAENRKIIMNDELQADIDRVIQIWADCRSKHAKSGPWLFGQFSIADAMYAPVAFRFASYGVFVENEAREYLDYLLTHPAMQEWRLAACEEIEVLEHEEVGIGTQ